MEMCYDGALVMPSSYAVMDSDEMTYVEGGKFSWSSARTIVYTAIGYVLGKFISGVTTAVLKSVINVCAGWITSAIDTAILTVMCYPGKVAATAAAVALLGAAGYGIYKVGRSRGKW